MDDMQAIIPREAPEVDERRKQLVKGICDDVAEWEKHWQYAFERMRKDRRFARGQQWPDTYSDIPDHERPYVANITLRHLKQRTAAVYARNPKIRFRARNRMWYQLWDGDPEKLLSARARVQAAMSGDPAMVGAVGPASADDVALVQEYDAVAEQKAMVDRIGQTAQLLIEYYIGEQNRPHKMQMKRLVMRAHTVGLAYVRPDYQRVTGLTPENEQALKDVREQLARIERISADIADDEAPSDGSDGERLRLMLADIQRRPTVLLREGLSYLYPDPTCIIPDMNCTSLLTFEGCERVAEKYLLTPERIEEVYKVDVKKAFTKHKDARAYAGKGRRRIETEYAAVYEVWDKGDNLVYTICDGYPDFLVEPQAPDVYVERFWPWLVYAPNWNDDDEDPFPPSDVQLMMAQQMEINRAGEGLRDHRFAARPRLGTRSALDDKTRTLLADPRSHTVLEMNIPNDTKAQDYLFPVPTSPIDPNLYNTGPTLDDVQRVVGSQEANLGSVSGATATETSIAENSRQSALTSSRDELDDLLTNLARISGQIVLMEMQSATVAEIVGPGAAWPQTDDRQEIAKEVLLEVEAGSTGRPNQAEQLQARERLYPFLLQVPEISPRRLAADMMRVMDDSVDPDDWWEPGTPSIAALNGQMQAQANAGAQGGANAPRPPEREGTPGPPR